MKEMERISIDNLIEQLNDIADECFLPHCKIMPIDDQAWWREMSDRYGMEMLYEIRSDGIKRGDFDWNHKYFRLDSETQMIKSFSDAEDIIDYFGREHLIDLEVEF